MSRGRWHHPDQDQDRRQGHHDWSSAAFQPPTVKPEDPAMIAGARAEREFVRAKRAAGVSWFNLARMTGRTVEDLKRAYGGGS